MKQKRPFIVDILFVLALFGVFTLSALMLVTIGAEVYRHTVDDMSNNYEVRTSIAYITEKIRQNDCLLSSGDSSNHGISISTLAGEPALRMVQNINGEDYLTYLYLYEGSLKELYIREGTNLGGDILSAGQDIMPLSAFHMEQVTDKLLSIELVSPTGKKHCIYTSLHCTP